MGNQEKGPVAGTDGTNYLVLWKDYREGRAFKSRLMGARVDRSGKALDPQGLVIGGPARAVAVAFGGDQYLVAWVGDDRNISTGVFAARVHRDGRVLDAKPLALLMSNKVDPELSVAWNGSVFLVVWSGSQAARISKDGAVMDPGGYALGRGAPLGRNLQVSSDGRQFLVIWQASEQVGQPESGGIRGSLLGPDGTVANAAGELLSRKAASEGTHSQQYPSICFDGDNYHVAWHQTAWDKEPFLTSVRGALVSKDGRPTSASVVLWPGSDRPSFSPITCGGSGSGLPGSSGLARMDREGRALNVVPLTTPSDPNGQMVFTAASVASEFLVVWNQGTTLMTTSISAAGGAAQPAGRRLLPVTNRQSAPSVARGAAGYLAVWQDDREGEQRIYGALVDDKGAPTTNAAIPIGVDAAGLASPAVAWNGRTYLVAWADGGSSGPTLRGARLDGQGRFLGPAAGVKGAALDGVVALASDGDGFLLAWSQPRASSGTVNDAGVLPMREDLFAVRLDADGTPGTPLVIAPGNFVDNGRPAVTFGGESYVVTWSRVGGTAHARLVDRTGTQVRATQPVTLGKATNRNIPPVAAWDGKQYLVASADEQHLLGRRLSPEGVVIDSADVKLAMVQEELRSVALAWNGRHFLLGWQRGYGHIRSTFVARVAPGLALPDGDGLLIAEPVDAVGGDRLALASDGNDRWLAVYDRYEPAPELQTVRVSARLLTDCTGPACPVGGIMVSDGGAPSNLDGGFDASRSPEASVADGGFTSSTDVGTDPNSSKDAGEVTALDARSSAPAAAGCGCDIAGHPREQGGAICAVFALLGALTVTKRRRR